MKFILVLTFIFNLVSMQAQYSIQLVITERPSYGDQDTLYLAGDFNQWNPANDKFRFASDKQGQRSISLQLAAGSYQFKITRGNWDKVETDASGRAINNRELVVSADGEISVVVAGWKDAFAPLPLHSTASPRVQVIDTAFVIPELNRTRRIWVYLPGNYSTSEKKYPVLYMHDGQNLFDNATAFNGEWGVDELMDSYSNACIVVGIDNGGTTRLDEYRVAGNQRLGPGQGKEYLSFIVHTLKPFIDHRFRTLATPTHTMMAGSSMGGLISFYAGLYYPDVFGKLGIFSPSFWIDSAIADTVQQTAKRFRHGNQRYYFYAGGQEGAGMTNQVKTIAALLSRTGSPRVKVIINPMGKHNEASWQAAFPGFWQWVMRK